MKYICIVEPLNDRKGNRYLFTYDFAKQPEINMIVHCETKLKGGMFGKVIEWARMPRVEQERLVNVIKWLAPDVTLPLKPIDTIYEQAEVKEAEE